MIAKVIEATTLTAQFGLSVCISTKLVMWLERGEVDYKDVLIKMLIAVHLYQTLWGIFNA